MNPAKRQVQPFAQGRIELQGFSIFWFLIFDFCCGGPTYDVKEVANRKSKIGKQKCLSFRGMLKSRTD
jgi:hypothetical protein